MHAVSTSCMFDGRNESVKWLVLVVGRYIDTWYMASSNGPIPCNKNTNTSSWAPKKYFFIFLFFLYFFLKLDNTKCLTFVGVLIKLILNDDNSFLLCNRWKANVTDPFNAVRSV